jgi:non-homologous end joining protein Ku
MIELAEHILETKAGPFDPSEFEDRYETTVVEMLKRKQAGMPIERQPEAAAAGECRQPHGRVAPFGRSGEAGDRSGQSG